MNLRNLFSVFSILLLTACGGGGGGDGSDSTSTPIPTPTPAPTPEPTPEPTPAPTGIYEMDENCPTHVKVAFLDAFACASIAVAACIKICALANFAVSSA